MMIRGSKLFLISFMLVFSILICVNFVSAWVDCWQYSGWAGGTNTTCIDAGTGSECRWETTLTDPWCDSSNGCCMMKGCMEFDGNETGCTDNSINGGYNCTWDSYMSLWYPNGTQGPTGGCMMDFSSDGGMVWGGMSEGCWNNDGSKFACNADNSCSWKANDANQNPWCWIKNLFDAQAQNSFATTSDIGCCDMRGCWDYDGNETQCVNNTAFNGTQQQLCTWTSKENDPWCPNSVGCCMMKGCSEINNAEDCLKLKQDLMMPCKWDDGVCTNEAGGGFFAFNDTDSCMGTGGWWNGTDCEIPSGVFAGGAGGFMFVEDAHCWFADNQPNVCKNMTGCIYCNASDTHFNISGTSGTLNESSACYNNPIGFCQGHQSAWTNFGASKAVYDIATDNLNCTHIQIKSACEYGPLPNCKWANSSSIIGVYCEAGTTSSVKSAPPVTFCEHPDAKNNYTLCLELQVNYMMPCKWGNSSSNLTSSDNCTFNSQALFGAGGGEKEYEYEIITSEMSCVAAGGTWMKEYYLETDSGIKKLKQDQWCEKGALYDLSTGQAAANKGSCDADCWACEFNSSGTNYGGNVTLAEAACTGSALGYCRWTTYSGAPNDLGWCDYPEEMSYGAGDCQTNCKDCGLMQTPYTACVGSVVGCKWVNDTYTNGTQKFTGSCVSQNKKVCDNDCFSCYDSQSCFASSTDCFWDDNNFLCKPYNFDGEICFDDSDNDNDGLDNCADPDCSFDMACGGASFGDCAKYDVNASGNAESAYCNDKIAFGDQNCTWINNTWEPVGHCGMPGENCWQYDSNLTKCGETAGCTNESGVGFDGFCDMNMTKMDDAACWNISLEPDCTGNCQWVNHTNPDNSVSGFCDYYLFAKCIGMDGNATGCNADGNCTWFADEQICDPVCFVDNLNSSNCITGNRSGICEWRDSSDMCMPEFFDMMGGGSGAKSGCMQYDGNYTACIAKNYTCIWFNDSNVDNNVSVDEPDGWCNNKGEFELSGDMKGEPVMLGMDSGNPIVGMGPGAESGVLGYADILGFGMKITGNAYGFGIGIYNLTDSALCNGYPLSVTFAGAEGLTGTGQNTTRFKWYLDTDGNTTALGHCYATDSQGTSLSNFEFYIDYLIQNNTDTGNIKTTKKLYVCTQNSSGWQWVPTNVFLSDDKKFACFSSGKGAAFVSVEKETLENFALFDMTKPMRVFAVSFNGSGDGDGADEVGPAYYTPGTVDFGFIDCSNPNTKDMKCKNFQKFGMSMFEDCKNGIDDDSDGYTDCNDAKCAFSPACTSTTGNTAFDFSSGANDNKAPIVVFSKVDKMANAVIVIFDTDEPANGSLMFYNNSATCAILNATLTDLGDPGFTYDDYKPYHKILLDINSLNYSLLNATAYYYKVKVCDGFGNCGTSKCLNFTTREQDKSFLFRMDIPAGMNVTIPSMGLYGENFTYNETGSGNTYDVAIKTNTSVTTNMNITVNYGDMSIKFVGADLYKPKVLNLENAFITDTTNNALGMNSSSQSWNQLISDLGMGGAGDSIELNFPAAYAANNTLTWYYDNLTGGQGVKDYTTCWGNTSITTCKIPTTLGFSAYKIITPAAVTEDTTSSGGSSGGGGGGAALTGLTYIVNDEQFKAGYTKELAVNDSVKVNVNNESHKVKIISVTSITAQIEVSSEIQLATLTIGDTRRFDVTEDDYYDISVALNSINSTSSKAEFTVKSIYEQVTQETIAEEEEKEEVAQEKGEGVTGAGKKDLIWLWVLIIVLVLVVIISAGIVIKKKSK